MRKVNTKRRKKHNEHLNEAKTKLKTPNERHAIITSREKRFLVSQNDIYFPAYTLVYEE